MSNHTLTLRFEERNPQTAARFNLILAGKIQADHIFTFREVRIALTRSWSSLQFFPQLHHVAPNTFVFEFQTEEDRRTIEHSVCSVRGRLMVLRRWDGTTSLRELEFGFPSFWVQLHNLPAFCYSEDIVRQIAAVAGDVHEVDDMGLAYARVRVLVNITEPLTAGVIVERPERITDCWVHFKYESLLDFCYNCGRITHSTSECRTVRAEDIFVRGVHGSLSAYGPWLRADDPNPPAWNIDTTNVIHDDEEEGEGMDDREL